MEDVSDGGSVNAEGEDGFELSSDDDNNSDSLNDVEVLS